ncbi:MAG: DUF3795 domain-containing protein [Ruminococcus sp.]|nr:DUF3795 domain-containing protein [Ruminococcus sp.]
MIQSRCGILCGSCEYRESMGCKGCVNIGDPFWGKCSVKTCCEDKKLKHCGQCSDFVCQTLHDFAYDGQQGDNGKRLEQCRQWLEEEKPVKCD